MRIILHAGVHKTGSSSIQEALRYSTNLEILGQHNVCVPLTLPANQSQFFVSSFGSFPERYHANAREGLDRAAIANRIQAQTSKMLDCLLAKGCQTIVFSGEDISTLSVLELQSLREALCNWFGRRIRISVFIYTRHHISFVQSAIQQNVKGNDMTVGQSRDWHMKNCQGKYRSVCERFESVFRPGALEVFSFEQATRESGSVVAHFGGCVTEGLKLHESGRRNSAVSDEVVRFISICRESGYRIPDQDLSEIAVLPGSRGGLLRDLEKSEIAELSADDRRYLEERWGIVYTDMPASEECISSESPLRFKRAAKELASSLSRETRERLEAFATGLA